MFFQTLTDDANYSYIFRGRSSAVAPVVEDTVYTAEYTKQQKNVSYVDANANINGDGAVDAFDAAWLDRYLTV